MVLLQWGTLEGFLFLLLEFVKLLDQSASMFKGLSSHCVISFTFRQSFVLKAWVPRSYAAVYLFSILHDTISLQVCDWRWSSILARSCLSLCVRAKTGALWAEIHILCERGKLKFLEGFKFWFRSDKSRRYFTWRAFEHTLLAELFEFNGIY